MSQSCVLQECSVSSADNGLNFFPAAGMRASNTPSGRWNIRRSLTIPLVLLCSPSWSFDSMCICSARLRQRSVAGDGSPREFSTTVFSSSELHLRDRPRLLMVDDSDRDNQGDSNGTENMDDILSRFTSPVIYDPRLGFSSRLSGVRVEPLFGGLPLVK